MDQHDGDEHEDHHEAPPPPARASSGRRTITRQELAELRGQLGPAELSQAEMGPGFAGMLDGEALYLED